MREFPLSNRTVARIDFLALFVYFAMEIYFWYLFFTTPSFWIDVLVVAWTVNTVVFGRIVWRERTHLSWKPKGG